MKVCTDSCLLGAIAATIPSESVLDIGTGTGLLALMIAQKTGERIDAVEIDHTACIQAGENFAASPWKEKIHLFNSDVESFYEKFNGKKLYNLIVCNPPFFDDHLISPNKAWNLAGHSALNSDLLIEIVKKFLGPNGIFILLMPPHQMKLLEAVALSHEVYPLKRFLIYDKINGKQIRTIQHFSLEKTDVKEEILFIKDSTEKYTREFQFLLQDYYLQL